jgi:hypothetical protein
LAEMEMLVVLEKSNVAVSAAPLGMVGGVQSAAWFQSPVGGLVFHVALSAKVLLAAESRSSNIATVTINNRNRKHRGGEGTASDIDEERGTKVFIIESFQMTEASPRRSRRRLPIEATGRIWCGVLARQILLARGFASQDKNARCGKIFAAQQHPFQLLMQSSRPHNWCDSSTLPADASAVQAVTPNDIYSWASALTMKR